MTAKLMLFAANLPIPELQWPYLQTLQRLALALAIGFFIGLERERRGKDAGARTFTLAALLGCLGALEGGIFAPLALGFVALLVVLLSVNAMRAGHGSELTTGAALLLVGFIGLLCGQGHTLTPTALGVLAAALLAWKEPFTSWSLGLTEAELRSAILLGILAFVIYPALPEGPLDRWKIIDLRTAWVTVLLIAAIGFANYILLKVVGAAAIELTGFFGGLVNSTVTVAALSTQVGEHHELAEAAYRGTLLATIAMILRNAVLLGILAPATLVPAAPALLLMLLTGGGLVAFSRWRKTSVATAQSKLPLESPFSLVSALKFGLLFLGLNVAGTIAQRVFGQYGFYAVSLVGGLVSSASSVASAGALAHAGTLSASVAGTGGVIASLASTLVDLPVIARVARQRPLTRKTAFALGLITSVGAAAAVVGVIAPASLEPLGNWARSASQVLHR
jgi:uncharacterized membrane protein (DUF4010 family)